jgi:hypothetical protein
VTPEPFEDLVMRLAAQGADLAKRVALLEIGVAALTERLDAVRDLDASHRTTVRDRRRARARA